MLLHIITPLQTIPFLKHNEKNQHVVFPLGVRFFYKYMESCKVKCYKWICGLNIEKLFGRKFQTYK